MSKRALLVAAVLIVLGLPGRTFADPASQAAFTEANDAFFRGQYLQAAQGYERLVELGLADHHLLYNLGTAYVRADRLGPAIYALRRASALAPADPDIQRNLTVAQAVANSRLTKAEATALKGASREPAHIGFGERMSRPALLWATLAGEWLLLGLWLWRSRMASRTAQRVVGVVMTAAAVFVLVGLVGFGVKKYVAQFERRGIVLAERTPVKEGPNPAARTTFEAVAGLPVGVTSEENGWMKVRLSNGLEGWIPSTDVGRL